MIPFRSEIPLEELKKLDGKKCDVIDPDTKKVIGSCILHFTEAVGE